MSKKKDKNRVAKKRVVTWESTDNAGNDTAFAIIDLRVPSEDDSEKSEKDN
jgi:hypothetical protein